jgi:hypothetical protein
LDIHNLTKVDSTHTGPGSAPMYGFDIIGVHGRPLVGYAYEQREEAEAPHELIGEAIAGARLITPMASP